MFSHPTLAVLETLTVAIGLPFVLLSATSTLLQVWYHRVSREEPFALYAVSNAGSLLGLVSYPFLFEPFLATYELGTWWVLGVALYAALLAAVVHTVAVSPAAARETAPQTDGAVDPVLGTGGSRMFLIWMGLAGVPVAAMLGATTFMTTAIAPVPFLWVGPLALYLTSFIVSFRDGAKLPRWLNGSLAAIAGTLALVLVVLGTVPPYVSILVLHLAVFALYHWCHDYLYDQRPHPRYLARFYVAISLGGIVASLLMKGSAEFLLPIPIELPLIFVGAVLVAVYGWYRAPANVFPSARPSRARLLIGTLGLTIVLVFSLHAYNKYEGALEHARNFFGYKVVREDGADDERRRSLGHGLTNHGYQYLNDELQYTPTSYYSTSSGLGTAISHLRAERGEQGLSVAIAGLGTGAILAYCQPNDRFYIAEIDQQVVAIAREHFTYLEYCPQAVVETRDARLALAAQAAAADPPQYDLIILDAYADDMMPIHLMTTEAIGEYLQLLKPDGILAIHISSRYLELRPVIYGTARTHDLAARYYYDAEPMDHAVSSLWTVLSPEPSTFDAPDFAGHKPFTGAQPVVWTDTYSALFPVVEWW
ncbi:MAG: hypothetical protein GVY29_09010 [Spirochaetes bacterium]|nr:hypothetical protein [Spirochaetota bacterium]